MLQLQKMHVEEEMMHLEDPDGMTFKQSRFVQQTLGLRRSEGGSIVL
jgi:hypothetical protein